MLKTKPADGRKTCLVGVPFAGLGGDQSRHGGGAPVKELGIPSEHDVEIHLLQLGRNRSGLTIGDGPAIQLHHRCQVCCGAGEENFLSQVGFTKSLRGWQSPDLSLEEGGGGGRGGYDAGRLP